MNGFFCVGLIVMQCFAGNGGQVATISVECPPLKTWSPAFQRKLAKELRALPKGAALAQVTIDAIADRDVVRACRSAKH